MPSLLDQIARRAYRGLRRRIFPQAPQVPQVARAADFQERKRQKLERIRPLLDERAEHQAGPLFFDFLSEGLRREFKIVSTDNVSAHPYDHEAMQIIRDLPDGWILDCGAGLRPEYHDNVVNFEICNYPTTDVRGVGEKLPFRSGVFDAVFSFSVLEHVRDPFACAREIARVLKPGGRLYAVVPFLQPFHAYPHHYYNMTAQGLANLFSGMVKVERQEVNDGGMPIFMLTWVIQRWAEGLPESARREFLDVKLSELLASPMTFLERRFVTELDQRTRFDLAATTSLFARKAV